MACDHLVIRPDGFADLGQFCAELPSMLGGFAPELEHFQPGGEPFNFGQVAFRYL